MAARRPMSGLTQNKLPGAFMVMKEHVTHCEDGPEPWSVGTHE